MSERPTEAREPQPAHPTLSSTGDTLRDMSREKIVDYLDSALVFTSKAKLSRRDAKGLHSLVSVARDAIRAGAPREATKPYIETSFPCPVCKTETIRVVNEKSKPIVSEERGTLVIGFSYELVCTTESCTYDHVGRAEKVREEF